MVHASDCSAVARPLAEAEQPEVAVSRTASTRALLVSELFPPAVGGSAVLFHGIYSRLDGTDVVVLTDKETSPARPGEPCGRVRIVRRSLATRRWGILDPRAFGHHVRVAWQIRALLPRGAGLVHVGRALPEGVAAFLSRRMGGPDYVCWAHGEDLVMARSSRELTFLNQRIYMAARAALANSQNTAGMLEALGVPPRKIAVIRPAVDEQRFHPGVDGSQVRQRYAGPGEILLLSVGRLQRRKGHDVSIETIHALRQELPGLRYVIAGDGEERGRLQALVERLALQRQVFFAGVVPECELPAYYAACDVFLLPNRVDDGDIEGFGIVFLEAAATGKPAIGGDSGGVPEAIERDVTGLLVDGRSVAQLAEALRRLAGSPDLRRELGRVGRARVERFFTWRRAASAVGDVHRRLMHENHGGRSW